MEEKKFACPYGIFGMTNPKSVTNWQPNLLLKMTADEQYEHNIKYGFLEASHDTRTAKTA